MTLTLGGLTLFALGFLHRIPAIQRYDKAAFLWLHRLLWRGFPLFRLLWPLGSTPATLFVLFVLIIYRWPLGLAVSVLYAGAALIERGIKLALSRRRPFQTLSGVHMTQPQKPHDPSFPSGDALRVWYLVGAVAIGLHPGAAALWILISLAVLVSLGRIALGVHHPLDVLSGSGLGLFFAGLLHFVLL